MDAFLLIQDTSGRAPQPLVVKGLESLWLGEWQLEKHLQMLSGDFIDLSYIKENEINQNLLKLFFRQVPAETDNSTE